MPRRLVRDRSIYTAHIKNYVGTCMLHTKDQDVLLSVRSLLQNGKRRISFN
jgi:hypothetical protein